MSWYSEFSQKVNAYVDSYMPDRFTGMDILLAEPVKKNLKPISAVILGFGYGISTSWLTKESIKFAHEAITNSSQDAKLQLVFCICALQTTRRLVNCYIEYHDLELSKSLEKSIHNMAGELPSLVRANTGVDYLDSIYNSIHTYNTIALGIGNISAEKFLVFCNLVASYNDSALFTKVLIVEGINIWLKRVNAALLAKSESIKKEIQNIDEELTIVKSTYSNTDLVSLDEALLKKQSYALESRKYGLHRDLAVYGGVVYIAGLVSSVYYIYQSISALQSLDKSHASYSNLAFNAQKALYSIYSKDLLDRENKGSVKGFVGPENIEKFNDEYKKIAESQEALESLEGNKVYVTLTNPSKGTYVKYKCKYDKLAQSVHITGGNGSGKSCILRAIARSNILSSNPRSTTTISLYGKGLKKSDVVYIPQSGITALTNLTIYKNLADNTALSSWLSIIPSFVEDQKTGENIAGITPLDIFTAFLNKSQKDENENDIKEKIDELVKALDLKIFINTEDQKLVDLKKCIQLNPSGGEEHKIKFIMLALTALYGEKKLILVDELYNNLDQESTKVIQEQFINLLGEVKEKGVKFISTDHRETIAEGLYHKTEVLKAQSIS